MAKANELLLWFLVSLLLAPILILGHELFHYIPALFLSQSPVELHFASVSAYTTVAYHSAIILILGPIYSWSLVLLAFIMVKRKLPSAWLGLFLGFGLFASGRSISGLDPIIKMILGRDVSYITRRPSFDEASFAIALNIPWQIPTAFSLFVMFFGFIYFTRKAVQLRSWLHVIVLSIGLLVGVTLYMWYGPILFSGGSMTTKLRIFQDILNFFSKFFA